MNKPAISLALAATIALGVSACSRERSATESTGTATATVKTKAPENVVSASDLQQKAQTAADSVSVPVNGMTADGHATATNNATTSR